MDILEKINEKLKETNSLLQGANEALNNQNAAQLRIIYLMLQLLGGSLVIDHVELAKVVGKVNGIVNEDETATTLFIEKAEEVIN